MAEATPPSSRGGSAIAVRTQWRFRVGVAALPWLTPPEAEESGFPAPGRTPDYMARCVNTIAAAVHLGSNDASPGVPSTDAAGLLYWVANAAPGGSGRWPAGKQVHEGLAEHWGLDGAGPHGRNADWRRGKRPATWTDWNKGLGNPVV